MTLLELRFYPIEGKQDCFKVTVEGSSGEVHHEPGLPFLDSQTPDVQDRRFTVVKILESTKFKEDNFSEEEQAWMVREQLLLPERNAFEPDYLATIGRRLYQILGQDIQQLIEAAVAEAKRDRIFLHIRLWFPAEDPKPVRITDYPWELLHNQYGFLAHQRVTFSRYIAYRSPCPNLPRVERLNVLLISSGAGDQSMGMPYLPAVEADAIANGLQQAQEQRHIQLEILESATLKALRRRLSERQTSAVPQVLHFDGHGFFGKRCNEIGCKKAYNQGATQCECGAPLGQAQGYLVFEDSDGKADYVSAKALGELLGNLQRREQPHSASGIALVVLSACKSAMSRKSESVFNGVAQSLIGAGIPAVVAMTYSIRVDAASAFVESFYRSVGEKNSLAIALRQGQSAMDIEGNQWYRPVLYLRWEDNEGGQLFKSVEPDAVSQKNLPLQQVPSTTKSKVRKKPSRVKQLRIESLKQNLEKLEQDYTDVAEKLRRESNPQERNNLELQLENIANDMEKIEQQLHELEDGDE
ncbi:MAG: CHAT domain-containing protein [Moorea sp. SIO1G6]|uniref:CHAT domain-containing protein n=1 Tax=Moorena sp. SIO1G6 TaxID=2607840 RepID=UPI0013C0FE25|nr:CHAT domain-containing protein [Moorena sp. SIO1G6]NET68740.1 CHAT domain-containing protein [Moorena sp. SIO1G6]